MWPFGRKALTASPPVLEALRDRSWSAYPLLGGGSRQRIVDAYNIAQSANYAWMYTNSPAVRTVVDVIARNVGQLELRLYEEIDEAERRPRPDHPAALSMRYPNEDTTSDGFIRSMFVDFLIYANAYALLVPGPNQRLAMEHIPASSVEIRGNSLFRAEGYRYWRSDGTWVDFAPDSIMHWRGENPHDPRLGLSVLDTLRAVVAEDAALQQATVELANAGLTEPVWVSRPQEAPEWTNESRKRFEEDLTNRLRRRNKTPVVMEEGMRMESFGVSPKDAEMMAVRRWAIERVASLYGVPLGMVGLDDNLSEAQSLFYSDTLPPYCEQYTRTLNQRILVRVYDSTELCFEFNLDEKHMGDDRLKSLTSASGRPVLTTNESRAMINKPPIDGGDELVTPANVIVGENPKPSIDVMPIQDPNGPEQDGSYRIEPQKALVKAELPQHLPRQRRDLNAQFRAIDLSKAAIQRYLDRLERALRNKAGNADWARWNRELAEDLHQVVERIVEAEGPLYAFRLGGDFDMEYVRNYLKAMSEGAAVGINDTIRAEIDELGLDAAMNLKDRHVESGGAGLGAGATIWAREEAARRSPQPERRVKVWVANTARHAEFAGDVVPLGEDWPAGFAPGTARNCRCTLTIE